MQNARPTKTMDNTTLQQIKDALARNDTIGIVVGRNPTIDSMGAALAFYLTLTASNKRVSVASPTEPIVEISSLVGIDQVKTSLDAEGVDLVVSFPYKEGEIDKVSYTIESGYLNIVVKAGEQGLSFSERDIKYKRGGVFPKLLFVVGTPRLSDLGNLFNPTSLKDTMVVNIDNGSGNQGFGDIVLVSPNFSSVSEQVTNLIFALDLPIDQDTAQNLLSGIAFATDNFQKPNTSYIAFEMAAMLMRKGARRVTSQPAPRMQNNFAQMPTQDQQASYFPPVDRSQTDRTPGDRAQYAQPTQQIPTPTQPQPQRPLREDRQDNRQDARPDNRQRDQRPQRDQQQDQKDRTKNPPADWLVPKVYKGSNQPLG